MFFGLGSTAQILEQAHRLQVCQERHKAAQEDHAFDAFLHDSFCFFLLFSAFHFSPQKLHRSSHALTLSWTMQSVLRVLQTWICFQLRAAGFKACQRLWLGAFSAKGQVLGRFWAVQKSTCFGPRSFADSRQRAACGNLIARKSLRTGVWLGCHLMSFEDMCHTIDNQ